MRCASGARYAIAFKMALLSLVCLPQVPIRAARSFSSTPPPQAEPTSNSKLSTTSSSSSASSSTNTAARGPVSHRTENTNSETWTTDVSFVATERDDKGTVTHGPRPLTEDAKTDNKGVAVVEESCIKPTNRCDNIIVRKQGMCGCSKLNAKKVRRSGLKRSVLNKYRPQLN